MSKEKRVGEVSLCDDCAVVQKDGTPCGIMFSGDVVSTCNKHLRDVGKHAKLAEKYEPPQTQKAEQSDEQKGVK